MAYLAMRGAATVNGVSRLHGAVSRRIFAPALPALARGRGPGGPRDQRRARAELGFAWADTLWTEACGQERWRGSMDRSRPP